jgi:5-formyltetrahydrofolate cyclo-ligase
MEIIWRAGKCCYLPVLNDDKTLSFVRYDKGDALCPNRYSIQEPVNAENEISADQLDLVITPLIAFDFAGHRLGTGGGYYDRTFAFIKAGEVKRPFMLGLGFAAQQADALSVDDWDVLLDGVVTENSFIEIKS